MLAQVLGEAAIDELQSYINNSRRSGLTDLPQEKIRGYAVWTTVDDFRADLTGGGVFFSEDNDAIDADLSPVNTALRQHFTHQDFGRIVLTSGQQALIRNPEDVAGIKRSVLAFTRRRIAEKHQPNSSKRILVFRLTNNR